MLESHEHIRLVHARDEREPMCAHRDRVVAELALQGSDRRVRCVLARRHRVHDGGQVEVDAGGLELGRPQRRLRLERRRVFGALLERARDRAEAGSSTLIDLAAFLVGADQEADVRCRRRSESLDLRADLGDARHRCARKVGEPHRADRIRFDRRDAN